jgi:hypothetical protein
MLAKEPERETHVARDTFDRGFPAHVAHAILYRFETADFHTCGAHRVGLAHPAGCLLFRGDFQVRAQLVIEFPLDARLLKQAADAIEGATEQPHHSSPSDALRIFEIAVVWVSQSRASRLNSARPSGVNR